MTTNVAFKLSKPAQRNIIAFLQMRYASFGITTNRDRFEKIDRAIQLESVKRREKIEDYYDDIELGIVSGPIQTISNFLIDTFINSPNMFEVVTPKNENADAAKQMNAVNEENSKTSDWTREFILYYRDLPKYNYAIMECIWEIEPMLTITTDVLSGSPDSGAAIKEVARSGNVFKRWDVYNSFYDTSVDIALVHRKGEFAGTIERISMIELNSRIEKLKLAGRHVMNLTDIWNKGSSNTNHYYYSNIKPDLEVNKRDNGWLGFFGQTPTMKATDRRQLNFMFEFITLYARIIPSMFGIKVPGADKMQIWKFHIVNWDTVLYAEKQTNAHGFLPVIFTQIDEQGIRDQVKSAAEKLIPIQNLSTKLYDARIAGIARALGDRAIYDSGRIDKRHIDSDNPRSKIPVKPNILNNGVAGAYESILYNDNLGPTFLNEIGFLDTRADRISGLNNPQQGRLQKGNRTLGEFNEIMANADDDLRTWVKLVESQAMTPLKIILKTNILQFQPPQQIQSLQAEGNIEVSPSTLRKAALTFKVADGLVSKDALLDLPTARAFFELLIQSPQLQGIYGEKMPDLIEYIFTSIGFDTSQFRGQAAALTAPAPAPAQEGGQTNGQ